MEKRKFYSKDMVPGQNQKLIEVAVDNNSDSNYNIIITQQKNYQKEPFIFFFQQVNLFIAKILSASGCRILFYFLSQVKYNNEVDMDISDMGRDLKYSKSQMLRGVKELTDLGLITVRKSAKDKRRSIYIINPLQSWKGKDDDKKPVNRKTISAQFFPDNQLKLRFPDEQGKFPEAKLLKLLPNNNFDNEKR